MLIGFTLLGGLQALSSAAARRSPARAWASSSAWSAAFAVVSGLLDLPFDYYRQFVLEERFGFNKMTLKLWIADMVKGVLLGAAIGLPLVWVVLTLMDKTGPLWWLYAWLVWSGFQLLMMVLYPTVIAPMFNKFTPLADDSLKARIEGLMQRVGFASKGLFVMDGSKRSAHGNAYFSGFGANKRIVFFDTLLARLAPQEIEAVLAHELGHFKLKHIVKRIVVMFARVARLPGAARLPEGAALVLHGPGRRADAGRQQRRDGADPVHAGAAGVHLRAVAADLDQLAQARIRGRRLRRQAHRRARPGLGAGQDVRR